MLIIIFILGLLIGSFIAALSFRMPRNVSIAHGRSFCPDCKKQIQWFDNIPLLSFILLGGKCRYCHHKISIRYPLIELGTALVFAFSYSQFTTHQSLSFLPWPVFLSLVAILVAIFVIDWEHQIIPDELIFVGVGLVFATFIISDFSNIFGHIFAGFTASLFLLLIHLLTLGRGMGLGDVKLAVLLGLILGVQSISWLFVSFLLGGVLGLVLIILRRAKMADRIAFGPFLVVGFFVVYFWPKLLDISSLLMLQ